MYDVCCIVVEEEVLSIVFVLEDVGFCCWMVGYVVCYEVVVDDVDVEEGEGFLGVVFEFFWSIGFVEDVVGKVICVVVVWNDGVCCRSFGFCVEGVFVI